MGLRQSPLLSKVFSISLKIDPSPRSDCMLLAPSLYDQYSVIIESIGVIWALLNPPVALQYFFSGQEG